jgi:hypothetical protein
MKNELLKKALDVMIGIYYKGDLNDQGIYTAIQIFEELLDSDFDMSDYIKLIRMMRFDLDHVMV